MQWSPREQRVLVDYFEPLQKRIAELEAMCFQWQLQRSAIAIDKQLKELEAQLASRQEPVSDSSKVHAMKFVPLPFDYFRCRPQPGPAAKCRICARWADHPEQAWGNRTPMESADPNEPRCDFISAD
jgi:hypothetical protein